MRPVLYFGLSVVAWASANFATRVGYHETIGIPLAKRIKKSEDRMIAHKNNNNSVDFRIIGGSVTPLNAYPFVAGLLIDLTDTSTSYCTASLLTTNRLLTAAHCWWDGELPAWKFTAVLGSLYLYYGGTRIETTQVILHPHYVAKSIANHYDIAMVYLPINVEFNYVSIAPIDLPRGPELQSSFEGQWAVAIGFGKTREQQDGSEPVVLSHVRLQVISLDECKRTFYLVTTSEICTSGAGTVGVCSGDSGGPLAIYLNKRPVLIGVTSMYARVGCEAGLPSFFTRVTAYYDFITQNL